MCLGPERTPDASMPAPRWPPAPAALPAALTAYYREMEKLARTLLRVFAAALDLPPDFFVPLEDRHWSALRCLNYPHSDKPFRDGQMRIAAHTDYGTLTILRADNVPGGLQVRMADGTWRDVVFPPDCFTINLGDVSGRARCARARTHTVSACLWPAVVMRLEPHGYPPPPPCPRSSCNAGRTTAGSPRCTASCRRPSSRATRARCPTAARPSPSSTT